jgi:hypothetical protein
MAKLTSIFLVPLMAGVWGWAWWRWPERPRSVLSGVMALAMVVALTGWFFARNLSLYGGPLALAAHAEAFAGIAVAEGQRMTWLLSGFLPDVFTSLLGWFGWWILPPAEPLVAVGGVVVAVAAVGWVLGLRVRRPASAGRAVTVLLVVACVLVFGTVLRFNMQFHQPQGRYLFGAIGPLAVLVALGLHNALGGLSALRPLAVALPPTLAAVALFGHFRPAFDSTLTPVPDHYAAMVPGLTDVSAPTTLQLLSPADGATLTETPEFRWRPDEGAAERLYTLHAWTGDGRIYLATFEWGHIELGGDRWALPAPVWDLLPSGTDFFWRVRVVPDRKAGETAADAASSPAFRFVKRGP